MKKIEINRLARVEGLGGLKVEIEGKEVRLAELNLREGARFFEAIVRGKDWQAVAPIISRICAICSAAHTICAQMAVEDAFGIKISRQTFKMRGLLLQGETLESHALHLFLLVLPDYLGFPSALEMAKVHQEETQAGLFLKKLGNLIQETVGGRAIHPVNVLTGRFGRLPDREASRVLLEEVEKGLKIIPKIITLFQNIPQPEVFTAETNYMALKKSDEFGFMSQEVATSSGEIFPAEDFARFSEERFVHHSNAKQFHHKNHPFMVGAQARLVINGDKLTGLARRTWSSFRQMYGEFSSGNPLLNNLAQAVEIVFSLEKAREILLSILEEKEVQEEAVEIKPSASIGIGMVEAPRGILYHRYRFDEQGTVLEADVITPTALNQANIERDLMLAAASSDRLTGNDKLLTAWMAPFSGNGMDFLMEVIVRAYDPCISCSVH